MRLKLEGEAWGYRASPDLGATDPTLPLTTRMALARRTMRVQEAELEAKEAERERVQRGHERSRRARSGTIPSFQARSMVAKPSEAVSTPAEVPAVHACTQAPVGTRPSEEVMTIVSSNLDSLIRSRHIGQTPPPAARLETPSATAPRITTPRAEASPVVASPTDAGTPKMAKPEAVSAWLEQAGAVAAARVRARVGECEGEGEGEGKSTLEKKTARREGMRHTLRPVLAWLAAVPLIPAVTTGFLLTTSKEVYKQDGKQEKAATPRAADTGTGAGRGLVLVGRLPTAASALSVVAAGSLAQGSKVRDASRQDWAKARTQQAESGKLWWLLKQVTTAPIVTTVGVTTSALTCLFMYWK